MYRRAAFVVKMRSGIGYCADHLACTITDGETRPALSFICSGRSMTVPVEDVADVEFQRDGATWCSHCDQPLPYVTDRPLIASSAPSASSASSADKTAS